MGQPAARVGDMHMCPMVTPGLPPVPHVGGPVLPPGVPTVLIGGMPAATVGCMCTCVGPPDVIIRGSFTVLIGGRPAARMGDNTAHGGVISIGCPTVLIGDFGIGSLSPSMPEMPTVNVIRDMTAASPESTRKAAQAPPGAGGSMANLSQADLGELMEHMPSDMANQLNLANRLSVAARDGIPQFPMCTI